MLKKQQDPLYLDHQTPRATLPFTFIPPKENISVPSKQVAWFSLSKTRLGPEMVTRV